MDCDGGSGSSDRAESDCGEPPGTQRIALGALLIPSLVNQGEDLANNAPEYAQDVTDFVNKNETLRNLNDDYYITAKLQDEAEKLPSKVGDAAGTN